MDEESSPGAGGYQAFVLENRQRFPYGRTTNTELSRQALLEEWLAGFYGAIEDRLLDGTMRNFSISRSALSGNSR